MPPAGRSSVLEVVDAIRAGMKIDLEPIILNEATNEIREQYLDFEQGADSCSIGALDLASRKGSPRTIEWYRKHLSIGS